MAKRTMKIKLPRKDPAPPGTAGRLHVLAGDVVVNAEYRFVGRVTSGALAFAPADCEVIYVTDDEVVSFRDFYNKGKRR